MRRLRFVTADVFTGTVFGGNPLAVIPEAGALTAEEMQAIAGEFNLSETVFVLPPADPAHTRRLRIFTPRSELPFAGHPTVGTALVLARLGEIPLEGDATRIVFEEGAGPVPVTLGGRGGRAEFAELTAPQAPEIRPAPEADVVAAALGLAPEEVDRSEGLPRAASCGVPFVLVGLASRAALARARLDRAVWERGIKGGWAEHLFLVTRDAGDAGADFRARMFAPGEGIEEDPATGSAASAFGGWLGTGLGDGGHRFVVAQGHEMGRPSRIEIGIERRDGQTVAVRVGGGAVMVMDGTLGLPD